MPPPLAVDRQAARVLAVAIGVRPAARQLGISESAMMQWSKREGWFADTKPRQQLPTSMKPVVSGVSVNPAVALQEVLAETNGKSRLSYARNALRVTEHLETENVETLLERAEPAQKWASIASKAGGWEQADPRSSGPVLVNLDLRGLTLPEKPLVVCEAVAEKPKQ